MPTDLFAPAPAAPVNLLAPKPKDLLATKPVPAMPADKAKDVLNLFDAPPATPKPTVTANQPKDLLAAPGTPSKPKDLLAPTTPAKQLFPEKSIGAREKEAVGGELEKIPKNFLDTLTKPENAGVFGLLKAEGSSLLNLLNIPHEAVKAGVKEYVTEPIAQKTYEHSPNPEKAAPKLKQFAEDQADLQTMALAPGAFAAGKLLKGGKLAEEVADGAKGVKEATLPNRAADELYQLKNNDEARRVKYVGDLKKIKGVSNETWEKLYAHKDDPTVALTPDESKLYDTHIKPVAQRSEQILSEFKKDGEDLSGEYGAPRQVKGKTPSTERIYGNKVKEGEAYSGRKRISTFSPAAAARSMWAIPGENGARHIVYVADGHVYKDGEKIGEVLGEETRPKAGLETTAGKLQQATTKELEGATKLDYHKNLLANEYIRLQSLERARDAKNFLGFLKKDPEFTSFAAPKTNKEVPATWRHVDGIRELEDYKFEPKMAEVIEDYMGNIKSPEDYTNAVMNVAKATKASIFFNPIRHMVNATNMFATSKGLVGTARDLPKTGGALLRATRSVLTQDKEYREMAKAGMSLPSMRETAQKFNGQLMKAMGTAVQRDPKGMAKLAKEWGYKSTAGMVQALYKGSNKLLWAYSDILAMTRVNEYMARGLSRAEAIKRTERVMANYRIPSRVGEGTALGRQLGPRSMSKILQDPRATMFGRYDYNRFANLTGMIKRAASKDPGAWEARDQLLALGVISTLGYTQIDKWLQQETGDPGARYPLGGYSSLVDIGKDVAEGSKTPGQGIQSAFSPGFLSLPLEALTGQNMYTGKPIAQRADLQNGFSAVGEGDIGEAGKDFARVGFDVGRDVADKFAPVQLADKYLSSDDMTPAQFWLEQAGAKVPGEDAEAGRDRAEKYSQRAAKSAAKKRPDFIP